MHGTFGNNMPPVYINTITGKPVYAVTRDRGEIPGIIAPTHVKTLLEELGLRPERYPGESGDLYVKYTRLYRASKIGHQEWSDLLSSICRIGT